MVLETTNDPTMTMARHRPKTTERVSATETPQPQGAEAEKNLFAFYSLPHLRALLALVEKHSSLLEVGQDNGSTVAVPPHRLHG